MAKKKVGLALSGGGAKGLAHIGVIQALTEAKILISYIAGTSMGALVGAWYAIGEDMQELEDLFLDFKKSELFFLQQILLKKRNLLARTSTAQAIMRRFEGRTIESAKIPLAIVATDVQTGDDVVMRSGDIIPALRASISLPIIFPPVQHGEQILIDGGFSNPVPADVVRAMGAGYVIAVDVASRWIDLSKISRVRDISSLVANSLLLIEYQIAKRTLKDADLVIRPPVLEHKLLDFRNSFDIIQAGARETRRHLEALYTATGRHEPTRGPIRKFFESIFE